MIINITPAGVIESTIMYGIVHGVWTVAKRLGFAAYKEVRAERNRIIKRHVKAGHESRLKHCPDLVCLSLRKPVLAQQEPVQALHTES